jgi:hypothetical protein
MFRCLKCLIDSSITDAKEVIKRAHNGERFTLCGCQLHVSEYHPPPVDPFKVYIKEIAATTTNECITNFIAAVIHLEPLSIIHGETPGTALVTFGSTIGNTFEPRHEKTNIVRLRPALIQISLRIRAV